MRIKTTDNPNQKEKAHQGPRSSSAKPDSKTDKDVLSLPTKNQHAEQKVQKSKYALTSMQEEEQGSKVKIFERVYDYLDTPDFVSVMCTNSIFNNSCKDKEEQHYRDQIARLTDSPIPMGYTAKRYYQTIYPRFLKKLEALLNKNLDAREIYMTHFYQGNLHPAFREVNFWSVDIEITSKKYQRSLTPLATAILLNFEKLVDSILKSKVFTDPTLVTPYPHEAGGIILGINIRPPREIPAVVIDEWNKNRLFNDRTDTLWVGLGCASLKAKVKDGSLASDIIYRTACFFLNDLVIVDENDHWKLSSNYLYAVSTGMINLNRERGVDGCLPTPYCLDAFDLATKNKLLNFKLLESLVEVCVIGNAIESAQSNLRSRLLVILFNNGAAINTLAYAKKFFTPDSPEAHLDLYTQELIKAIYSKNFHLVFSMVVSDLNFYPKFQIENWNHVVEIRGPDGMVNFQLQSLKELAAQNGCLPDFENHCSLLRNIRSMGGYFELIRPSV